MPSPSTPRRTSNRRDNKSTPAKSKPIDVGIPLGPYDTNSVRDRVRQWQAQGGGVITALDIGAEDGQEDPVYRTRIPEKCDVEKRFNERPVPKEDEESENIRRRTSRQTSRLDKDERDRKRSASAPRKRVISDGHWRKKRSPPRSATSSRAGKEPSPTRILPEDGIRIKPIPDFKAESRHEREIGKKVGKRESAGNDDGIRVYSTPPGSRRQSGHLHPPAGGYTSSKNGDNSDEELPSTGDSPTPSRKRDSGRRMNGTSPDNSPRLSSSAAKEGSRKRRVSHRKERTPDKSPRYDQGKVSEGKGNGKPHRGNILSQALDESKRIFSKTEPVPVQEPRIPSIEAWLNETPDPFIDTEEPPVEIPLPLKSTSTRKQEQFKVTIPAEIVAQDPNKIWDELDEKQGSEREATRSRRSRRVRSSTLYEGSPFPEHLNSGSPLDSSPVGGTSAAKLVDLVQDIPELTPPSLKRRGARREACSPSKETRNTSPLKESFTEEDRVSALSSANSVSSVEPSNPGIALRPPGLNIKRTFPSTGKHRLSTIASVETFNTKLQNDTPPSISDDSESTVQREADWESRDQFDPNALERRASNSRLTKHADLISVLSLPRAGSKSIQSARSIRTNRSRLATATIADLMMELSTDESKYMRELRTLVDGVIPVLLTCVLSKTDSAVAAGLFRPSASAISDPNFTRPIVDMGIALERLKTLHKRIPQQDPATLLTWAQGAQKVYSEYLKAWRMGFQDVVVNLAPAATDECPKSPNVQTDGLDGGLPRNKDGDIVNGDGERVDVAFLLKRPLVRLKYLAKTFKGINIIKPSAEAAHLALKYQDLVIHARNRSNEERARLEDEAAAAIDPTRARDPRTLGPLAGVSIDKTRRVRARDYFNLALQHTSGQRVDCRVELLLRDDTPDRGSSGDILICEVDGTGRWLLLPPVQSGRISARNGDLKGEIVVMIRGLHSHGQEWHELLSLRTEDEQTGFEWVQMLGLTPVPPKITRSQSFISKQERRKTTLTTPSDLQAPSVPVTPGKSRTPSPREIEVPIGEQARSASKTWSESPLLTGHPTPKTSPPSKERARLQKKPRDSQLRTPTKPSPDHLAQTNDLQSLPSQTLDRHTVALDSTTPPKNQNEALRLAGSNTESGLRRSTAKRLSRHGNDSPTTPLSATSSCLEDGLQRPSTGALESVSLNSKEKEMSARRSLSPHLTENRVSTSHTPTPTPTKNKNPTRPVCHRSRSSVPSLELPIIPKVRKDSPPTTPSHDSLEEPEWPSPLPDPVTSPRLSSQVITKREERHSKSEDPPPTPSHKSPSPVQLRGSKTPVLITGSARETKRRSSSPLKHEYEPSTASESSSDSDASTVERNEVISASESSEDEEFEDGDLPTPLLTLGVLQRYPKVSPQGSLYSLPNGTLSPSQSASQAPYKTVPAQPSKASKTIASIFAWSDTGSWQSLHPDECSIVITPGLIEAFEMSAAHSASQNLKSPHQIEPDGISEVSSCSTGQVEETAPERPLVALELTPLVPIRRGTALDISIRSPPTLNSKITLGNNIMFRSRNPEECEALYALINHSRINNPTYIALQNARGPYSQSSFSSIDRSRSTINRGLRSSSWFGLNSGSRSSYRASSAPTPSIAPSESSIGSMSSAFSALKRFGMGGSKFNISRSTVTSRNGSRANSIYTSSDNSSGSGASSPVPGGIGGIAGTEDARSAPIGLSNAKIRVYIRETASKWRDMGSARLTIMKPANNSPNLLSPGTPSRSQQKQNEKRIIVTGKTKGETLLDVTLGESCFERVARTGIALSVWEDFEGGTVAAMGGVGGGRATVYMLQVSLLQYSSEGGRRDGER
ncbi:hypothetical protein MMC24_002947 [Lignoscripta atroalba]|nr:hypothetical protein [Lignoscripta atroalba]